MSRLALYRRIGHRSVVGWLKPHVLDLLAHCRLPCGLEVTDTGYNAFFVRAAVAANLLPEVAVESCFVSEWNRYGIAHRFPPVADMEWTKCPIDLVGSQTSRSARRRAVSLLTSPGPSSGPGGEEVSQDDATIVCARCKPQPATRSHRRRMPKRRPE